jgi:hypothetical protein
LTIRRLDREGVPHDQEPDVITDEVRETPPSVVRQRHLFIVARHAPHVARFLMEQFPSDSNVSVVVDRRHGDRRAGGSQVGAERRAGDRRRRVDVERELRERSHAFVTMNCG